MGCLVCGTALCTWLRMMLEHQLLLAGGSVPSALCSMCCARAACVAMLDWPHELARVAGRIPAGSITRRLACTPCVSLTCTQGHEARLLAVEGELHGWRAGHASHLAAWRHHA